jgi:hypothetical protein
MIKMSCGLHVKYRLFLPGFNESVIFWADKFEISFKRQDALIFYYNVRYIHIAYIVLLIETFPRYPH